MIPERIEIEGKRFALEQLEGTIQSNHGRAALGYTVFFDDGSKGCAVVHVTGAVIDLWKADGRDFRSQEDRDALGQFMVSVLANTKMPISVDVLKKFYPNPFNVVITTGQEEYDAKENTLYVSGGGNPWDALRHVALNDTVATDKLKIYVLRAISDYSDFSFEESARGEEDAEPGVVRVKEIEHSLFMPRPLLNRTITELEQEEMISVDRGAGYTPYKVEIKKAGRSALAGQAESKTAHTIPSTEDYVSSKVRKQLEEKQHGWDLNKLLQLIRELNDNHRSNNAYATLMLIRAIVDHVPPMLGKGDFREVVSDYKWPETEKKYMSTLLNLKAVADDTLHRQVSNLPHFITIGDIPNPQGINRLLLECANSVITPADYHRARNAAASVAEVGRIPSPAE